MFGGPPKNPFGSPFGSSGAFGSDQNAKNIRKRGPESTESSGLFGMPPVPKIGEPSPFASQPKEPDEGEPFAKRSNVAAPNLFASALKSSGISSNIFGSGAKTPSPFGADPPSLFSKPPEKPDLFKSIEPKPSMFKSAVEKPFGNPFKSEAFDASKNPFKTEAPPYAVSKNPFKTEAPSEAKNVFKTKEPSNQQQQPPTKLTRAFKPSGDRENPFSVPLKPDESKSANVFKAVSESSSIFGASKPVFKASSEQSNPFKSSNVFSTGGSAVFPPKDGSAAPFKMAVSSKLQGRLGQRQNVFEPPKQEDTSEPTKRVERLASVEEVKTIKSIVCEQIPQQALNKKVLEKHFGKFGKVSKVIINIKKAKATILFEDHKSAKKAKEKGLTISPKIPDIGAIFYHKRVRKSTGEIEFTPEAEEESVERPTFARSEVEASTTSTEIRPKMSSRELLSIIRSQAHNETDKYNILEARDKLLREKMPPKSGEVRLKGTCPDICPEKERYSRAIKNQLRIYEKIHGGRLNHKAAIKEYSRSSADQEMPLLHELRPSKVLKVAMDHLLCNVIDRIESMHGSMEEWFDHVQASSFEEFHPQTDLMGENVGEWFEYLWSATRAIRKDITQQDLNCDPIAVDLMEKCARFHIMCAERLIEEESHNFDKKLNDENLTKCIQTLKHMYYDIGIEGQKCPNEAEFRGYDALLNINDGDTIRFIQTLDMDVRKSPEIKFAVDVISAVNNNNYIKFFKLVKKSTLMQGCILLRYFNQVRQRALETIVKAYVPAKAVVHYSLSKLSDMLAFENVRECARFCTAHGLGAEEDSDIIYMERSAFYYPESLSGSRAQNLVESKRFAPWSVVINNNRTLPSNPYLSYVPHDSFDKNGYLKGESTDALDQNIEKAPEVHVPSAEDIAQANAKRMREKTIAQVTVDVINEVINEECAKAAQSLMESVRVVEIARAFVADIQDDVVNEMAMIIAKDAIKEARNEELKNRLELEAKSAAAEETLHDILEDVLLQLVNDVAKSEMRSVEHTLDEFNAAPSVVDDIVNETIKSLVEPISKSVLDEAFLEREEKLQALRRRQQMRLKKATFLKWHKYVTKRKSQRSILQNFPCIPSSTKAGDQLKSNIKSWSLKTTLKMRKTVDKLHEIIELEDRILQESILEPMDDLMDVIAQSGLKSWKLLICSPTLDNDSIGRGLVEMAKKKLMINEASLADQDQDHNVLSCFSSPKGTLCSRWLDNDAVEDICYCEKKRREQLTGTSALLFIHIDEEECLQDAKVRLFKLVEQIPKIPGIALLILTTCQTLPKATLGEEFELQSLVRDGLVHTYDIMETSVDIFNIMSVCAVHNSIKGLVKMSKHFDIDSIEGLNVKVIRDYVEDFLIDKFFSEVYSDLSSDKRVPCHRDPNDLINLFNAVIDHLIVTSCSRQELNHISWPIPELKRQVIDEEIPSYWNDFPHLEHIRNWISNLKLPLMKPIKSVDDLYDYLHQIRRNYSDFSVALSRIESALKKAQRKSSSARLDLPWTDVIHALIDYKLGQRPTSDPFSTRGSDLVVVFFNQHLSEFKPPRSWKRSKATQAPIPTLTGTFSTFRDESKSQLLADLTAELDSSFAFEKNLHAMMSEENYEAPIFEDDSSEDENVEGVMTQQIIHYPVVSMLSPHLALVAGSRSLQQRLNLDTEMDSFDKVQGISKIVSPLGRDDKPRIKSHLVRSLNEKAQDELKSSMHFEAKLRAALDQ